MGLFVVAARGRLAGIPRRQSGASARGGRRLIHAAIRKLSTKPMPMLPSALPLEHAVRAELPRFRPVLRPRDGGHRRPGGPRAANTSRSNDRAKSGRWRSRISTGGCSPPSITGAAMRTAASSRLTARAPGRSPRARAGQTSAPRCSRACRRRSRRSAGSSSRRSNDLRFDRRLDAAAIARAARRRQERPRDRTGASNQLPPPLPASSFQLLSPSIRRIPSRICHEHPACATGLIKQGDHA